MFKNIRLLNKASLNEWIMLVPEVTGFKNKIPVSDTGCLPVSCWPQAPRGYKTT